MGKKERILIVEDDPGWQEEIAELLSEYTLITASSAGEACRLIDDMDHEGYVIDLVILDLELSKITGIDSGLTVLSHLNDREPEIPCIIFSGQTLPIHKAANLFQQYRNLIGLDKPGDMPSLAKIVRSTLDKTKSQHESGSVDKENNNALAAKLEERGDTFEYDVALSYASEDRSYVEEVAEHLREAGIRVFYDRYEQVDMWGKNLYDHLREIYGSRARYTVMFISKYYRDKLWTGLERETAQAKAFASSHEYILPAKFDDTEIPGMLPTTAYISLKQITPKKLAESIIQKLQTV